MQEKDEFARAPTVTNGVLISLIALVVLWVGVAAAFGPFDSAPELVMYFAFVLGSGFLGGVIFALLQPKSAGKETIWSTPASPKVGTLLINSVVSLLLCVLAVLILVMLHARPSTGAVAAAIGSLAAGAALGAYLWKRFSRKSLLPFGLSFFCAFLMFLAVFLAMKVAE